ncbi:hypothetical protein E4U30_002885 [Claviceps sp. LM220 group G6]|nr:hypothetical protein E4U30_002885 [Claviceps sp. LM220 group G6]
MSSKISYNLDKIRSLNSSTGWVPWKEDVTAALRMSGFGNLLKGKRDAEFETSDGHDASEARKARGVWLDKQETTCGTIFQCCGPRARQLLKDSDTEPIEKKVAIYFETLEKRYRSNGSVVLRQLNLRYLSLRLNGCKDVADYTDKLLRDRSDLQVLDKDAVIAKMFFVTQFLSGLSPSYDHFPPSSTLSTTSFQPGNPMMKLTLPA